MRWITRLAVFALAMSLGASAWYILAQRKTEAIQKVESKEALPVGEVNIQETSEPEQGALEQPIHFGPAGSMFGYVNRATVVLRESPDMSAPVVAKLKMGDGDSAEILGATRDFIHVRFAANDSSNGVEKRDRDYEGWTDWGSVTPSTTAIILDVDTGAVISRVPVGYGLTSVAYSPDGERATFYGGEENSLTAYEVRASDYTPTRSFASSIPNNNGSIFYSPSNGALYAAVLTRGQNDESKTTKLSIVRIGDEGWTSIGTELSVEAEDFSVAPDGLTGFILHRANPQRREIPVGEGMTVDVEMKVDVIDLRTFKIRNSFTLQGTTLPQSANMFVVNEDGTELYARLTGEDSVSVIDTRTGQLVRVLNYNSKSKDYWNFYPGDLVGDFLLLRIWHPEEDEMHSPAHVVWLGSSGRIAAEQEINCAIRTGGARYAVNGDGTRLLKLDSNNHIRARFNIERPELKKGASASDGWSVFGLSANPDGKRLILFVGIEEGC